MLKMHFKKDVKEVDDRTRDRFKFEVDKDYTVEITW